MNRHTDFVSIAAIRLLAAPVDVAASLLVQHCHLFSSPGAVLVGRDENCSIAFDSPKLSAFHLQVSCDGTSFRVKAFGSGVTLNGHPLTLSRTSAEAGARLTLPDKIELQLTTSQSVRDTIREAQLLTEPDNISLWRVFADHLNESGDLLGEWMAQHGVPRFKAPALRFFGLSTESTFGCLRRIRLESTERTLTAWLEHALASPYARFLTQVDAFVVDDESTDDENAERVRQVFELLLNLREAPPIKTLRLGFAFRALEDPALFEHYQRLRRHCQLLETPFQHLVETRQNLTLSAGDETHLVSSPSNLLSPDVVISHRQARFVIDAPRGLWVNGQSRRNWTLTAGDVLELEQPPAEHRRWLVGFKA